MIATPLDLQNIKDFGKGFRGYNKREVDSFVARVLRDYEQLYRRNLELEELLKDHLERLEQYELIEDTLQKTLVLAQETAEEVRKSAEKEGELIIEKARLHGENMLQAVEVKIQEMQEEYERLRQLDMAYRTQLRSFFEAQLLLLDQEGDPAAEMKGTSSADNEETPSNKTEGQELDSHGNEEVAAALEPEERLSLGL